MSKYLIEIEQMQIAKFEIESDSVEQILSIVKEHGNFLDGYADYIGHELVDTDSNEIPAYTITCLNTGNFISSS